MDRNKAAEIIERQRRRWHSQDSDVNIARRAERVYFRLAVIYVGVGTLLTLVQPTPFAQVAILAGFFFGASLFFWQGRRFTQIRKLLI